MADISEHHEEIQQSSVNKYDEIQVGRKNPTNQMLSEYPDEETAKRHQRQQPAFDDRPLPTAQKGIKDFEKHLEDQIAKEGMGGLKVEKNNEKEKFSKKQMIEIQSLSSGISQNVLEQVFSSNWHTREIGLEILLQEIDDWNSGRMSPPSKVLISGDIGEVLEVLWRINNMFLEERISQLLTKGIMMLSKLILLRMDHAPEKSGTVLSKLLDKSMLKILEKLGDYKNEAMHEKLSQLVSDIVEADLMSFFEMTEWLMKSKGLPRALNSFKHLIGKLMTLKDLICRFESDLIGSYRAILGHCCKCLENSNADVRNQANSLIVEVYRVIGGQKVNQYLNQTKIRKNHYENLKQEFMKIDNSSLAGSNRSSIRHSQDITSPPVEKSKFSQPKPKTKKKKSSEPEKSCNFCKQSSPLFMNDNDYDMHLWQDCPMLITCLQCTQVVEIADYTEHLLEECSNSEDFEECPRCRLAINAQQMEEHLESMDCAENGEQYVSCPLCFERLEADDDLEKVWFQHLILNTCSKNTRMMA